jgi:hypothetical protein
VEEDCNCDCDCNGVLSDSDCVLSDCNCVLSESLEFSSFYFSSCTSPLHFWSLREVPLLGALETLAFLSHTLSLPFLPHYRSSGVRWWVLLFYRAQPGVSASSWLMRLRCLHGQGCCPQGESVVLRSGLPYLTWQRRSRDGDVVEAEMWS